MDANKPIYIQIADLRNMWREVWWGMAGGAIAEYEQIKKTDVFEYWKLFDLWRERVDRERELYNKQNQRNGK